MDIFASHGNIRDNGDDNGNDDDGDRDDDDDRWWWWWWWIMIIIIIIIIICNASFPFRYDKSAVARSERALRYIKDKITSYQDLLQRIRLPSMETRRIQDKAPPRIRDLITLRLSKYTIRNDYILSLPKVNSTKYSLILWRYFAAEKWSELPNDIKIKAAVMK